MSGNISKENGKKGGRPKSKNTLTTEVMREFIAKKLEPELGPIIDVMIKKAKKGDARAAKELFDRAWGRPVQAVEANVTSESLPITTINLIPIKS